MPLFKKRGKMIVVFLYGNEDQYRFDVALFDCCPEKKRERFKKRMPLFKKKSFCEDSIQLLSCILSCWRPNLRYSVGVSPVTRLKTELKLPLDMKPRPLAMASNVKWP